MSRVENISKIFKKKEEIDMIKSIIKPKYKGRTLEILLDKFGYKEYFIECTYRFEKREGKYSLSLRLCHKYLDDNIKISSKEIDTQYISGNSETIEENICRVVHQMYVVKKLDYYIKRYEYEQACFEIGNKIFEQERLAKL